MWPQVPADIKTLSAADARALAREIKVTATKALAETGLTDEVKEHLGKRDELIAWAKSEDERLAALAALSNDDGDAEPTPAPTKTETTESTEKTEKTETTETAPAENAGDGQGDEAADGLSKTATKVRTTFGPESKPAVPAVDDRPKRLTSDVLVATDGVPGKEAGQGYTSWAELADALLDKAGKIKANSSEEFSVGKVRAEYPAERVLGDDIRFNLPKFDAEEIMAAYCAPATPYYGLSCMNTARRPVFNSLPQFQAPRMRVSIMPSPTLADADSGFGQWEDTDDDDPNAVKNCLTMTCGTPTEYKMYGVWRCLTVKNLTAMSYPELVEAWLNRLAAAHARLAETLLLEAMATGADDVNAPALGYGGSISITSTILNYIALYQEQQRWDTAGTMMEGWAHRWVLYGIKMDIVRRRNTGGGVVNVPTDDEINTMFRNVGVNMHWFIDTPSWAVAIPGIGGTLNLLPASVQILLAPPGKFALMDRGELNIGVTGNNLYRDNSSNARNQFTMFWENFEGIVNTNTCPAHLLDIPVCWNGVQIDDIVINCQGRDEVGYQS